MCLRALERASDLKILISFPFFVCLSFVMSEAYIFHVFSEARDHISILNILFFNKLRQIIPEVRSEMWDLLISESDMYIHTGSLSRVPNIA